LTSKAKPHGKSAKKQQALKKKIIQKQKTSKKLKMKQQKTQKKLKHAQKHQQKNPDNAKLNKHVAIMEKNVQKLETKAL
jgi:hypothetical protein